jgi:hypothetical protein
MTPETIRWLAITSITGTALQVAMVLIGHYNELVKNNVFAIGGTLISLMVGVWIGKAAGSSRGSAALLGAFVGGDCALVGIAVSFGLGDVPLAVLAFGTLGSAVAGLVGGLGGHALSGRRHLPT